MVFINALGGFREVGRSGIQISNILLDYGLDVQTMDVPKKPKNIDAVFLSHAHLDHSGNIPTLYREGFTGKTYMTPTTFGLCELLLKDSVKVQKRKGFNPYYELNHLNTMLQFSKKLPYNNEVNVGDTRITFFDAGHIPGAASTLVETEGKRILYTGDIKFEKTQLVNGAYQNFKNIDVLITESTYSYKNHPERTQLAKKLKEMIKETISNDGIAVLPCFAVGRTQEMLSILHDLDVPIHLDGMGIDATKIMLKYKDNLSNYIKLKKAFHKAYKIHRAIQRKAVLNKPGIVITTAGMLNGGPVDYYIKNLYDRRDCLMAVLGFQVPGTVGRKLLDTGRYITEEVDIKPKMKVEFMDFSAHCGRDNTIEFIKKVNPKRTILVHGDRTEEFAEDLNKMGIDAVAPKNGDKITI